MIEESYFIEYSKLSIPTTHFRHTGFANVLFCDGHVAPLPMAPGTLDSHLSSAKIGRLNPNGDTSLFLVVVGCLEGAAPHIPIRSRILAAMASANNLIWRPSRPSINNRALGFGPGVAQQDTAFRCRVWLPSLSPTEGRRASFPTRVCFSPER